MTQEVERKHHHLIIGELVFQDTTTEDGYINVVRGNGVLVSDTKDIPLKSIGKAQQILQLNFHRKMDDEGIKVMDVVILGFDYLGYFSELEFTGEAQEMKEKVEPVLDFEDAVAMAKGKK